MAYGQVQEFTATPQPGTSNEPYPSGDLPAFVPVTFTVTDTYGVAVGNEFDAFLIAMGELIVSIGEPGPQVAEGSLLTTLSAINTNLTAIATTRKSLLNSLDNLKIALGSYCVAINEYSTELHLHAANQIQSNNFYLNNNPDNPTLPTKEIQTRNAVTDSTALNDAARVSNITTNFINSQLVGIETWIEGTSVYQTVNGWIKSASSAVIGILPFGPKENANDIKGGGTGGGF